MAALITTITALCAVLNLLLAVPVAARNVASEMSVVSTLAPRGSMWQPTSGVSWQIVLSDALSINSKKPTIAPYVDVYDIDLFAAAGTTIIPSLHKMGKKVICYFSAGSYEPYRPDSSKFPDSVRGDELEGWDGEYWLDIRSTTVRSIMSDRIALAAQNNCDAIDPDNVDGYSNTNGLNLTMDDAVNYIKFLGGQARQFSLAMGLKNALDLIPQVLPQVQFAVNEQCMTYNECDALKPFVAANKPVLHIEYVNTGRSSSASARKTKISNSCAKLALRQGFSNVFKDLDLDGWVQYCNGTIATTLTA